MTTATATIESPPEEPVRQYPPVIHPFVKARLRNAARISRTAFEDEMARTHELLKDPRYNYRPLPMALRFHKSPKPFRWALGGNRSSKSHALAREVVWFATGTHPFRNIEVPNRGWYCTESWEMVGSILLEKIQELLTCVPHKITWRSKQHNVPGSVRCEIAPGLTSVIIFKAYNQKREAFQGVDRRYIANDEQFPADVYQEQVSRIGEAPLDFMTAMTPIKPQPWLETRLTEADERPDRWDVFEFPLDDNRKSLGGFIPDVEIDQLIEEWPEEIQPTRRLGKWASYLGAVYKNFNRKVHVVSEEKENSEFFPNGVIPDQCRTIGGIDFGGANPFVFLLATRIPHLDNEWYVFDEYYWDYAKRGVRLMRHHGQAIKDLIAKWGAHFQYAWADHDRQDSYELRNEGLSLRPAFKEDMLTGIETVQSHLKINKNTGRPRLHIAKRCRYTINEMATYRWPDGTDDRDPADNPVPKDDHSCDAVRYILESERSGRVGAGVKTKGKYRRQT